ncbi:hypothetical protein WR25_17740 [Diploscapter pachys]|uniref:Uncharacterized protein n=1 Tax=Diploscapter pachys TaxID=2018661 RepID=A0A2A2LQ80_9BILA|nr:hypothetical protein WR25_17740 [Diploscapter pachys]
MGSSETPPSQKFLCAVTALHEQILYLTSSSRSARIQNHEHESVKCVSTSQKRHVFRDELKGWRIHSGQEEDDAALLGHSAEPSGRRREVAPINYIV